MCTTKQLKETTSESNSDQDPRVGPVKQLKETTRGEYGQCFIIEDKRKQLKETTSTSVVQNLQK